VEAEEFDNMDADRRATDHWRTASRSFGSLDATAGRTTTGSEFRPAESPGRLIRAATGSRGMKSALRDAVWNRAVLVVFALPAVGYLAFLSQFVLGDPSGLTGTALAAVVVLALPVMMLYSMLLDVVGPLEQAVGTVGFFVFTYLCAVVVVRVARPGVRFIRRRRPPGSGSKSTDP
jgi:hypothetical protein